LSRSAAFSGDLSESVPIQPSTDLGRLGNDATFGGKVNLN
jgi:hypothetical protein